MSPLYVQNVQLGKCLIERRGNAKIVGVEECIIRRQEIVNVRKVRGCFGINNSVLSVSILGTLILKINNVRTALKTKFSGSSPASVNTVPTKSPISTDNTVTPVPMISTGTIPQNRAKIADKTKYIPNNFNLAFAPQINIKTSLGFALLVSYLDMSIMKL